MAINKHLNKNNAKLLIAVLVLALSGSLALISYNYPEYFQLSSNKPSSQNTPLKTDQNSTKIGVIPTPSNSNTTSTPAASTTTAPATTKPKSTGNPTVKNIADCYYFPGNSQCFNKSEYDSIVALRNLPPMPHYCDNNMFLPGQSVSPSVLKSILTNIENDTYTKDLAAFSIYPDGVTKTQLTQTENDRHTSEIAKINSDYQNNLKIIATTFSCVW